MPGLYDVTIRYRQQPLFPLVGLYGTWLRARDKDIKRIWKILDTNSNIKSTITGRLAEIATALGS